MELQLKKEELGVHLYRLVKDEIKKKIEKGIYKVGQLIPSENKLTQIYNVSRITVIKAINELVNEGYLYRIQGKGTFVKNRYSEVKDKIIGIIVPTEIHLWAPLVKKIISSLTGKYLCIPVDIVIEGKDAIHNRKHINSILKKNPDILIVDGNPIFPFELLDDYKGEVIYVINYNRETIKENKNIHYILSDHYYGAKIAIEYFLSKGFKRVIFVTYPILEHHKSQKEKIMAGKEVFKKNRLPEDDFVIFTDWNKEEKIKELLKKEKKPMAIFTDADFRANLIYEVAKKLNLKIPKDVSIIGYFNTPWCEILRPKLTSISIKEDKIGELVVKKILTKDRIKNKIIIKPKIVERESVLK
ncbi:MAG: GntR family transcriptional regulator [bacterium]|nr:GntR family transcriptional regulator [bacterium]